VFVCLRTDLHYLEYCCIVHFKLYVMLIYYLRNNNNITILSPAPPVKSNGSRIYYAKGFSSMRDTGGRRRDRVGA